MQCQAASFSLWLLRPPPPWGESGASPVRSTL